MNLRYVGSVRSRPLLLSAALLLTGACASGDISEVMAPTTTGVEVSEEPDSSSTTTTTAAATTTTTTLAITPSTTEAPTPTTTTRPANVYVNETVGFSFEIHEQYRTVGGESVRGEGLGLINRFQMSQDMSIGVSWSLTDLRTIDMFRDDVVESSQQGVDRLAFHDPIDVAGQPALDWESEEGMYEQRNVLVIHPDPYSGSAIRISSSRSCELLCPGYEDFQWDEVVALMLDSWVWLEPADRDVAECGVLGGGRYRVEFPAGEFGTTVNCSAIRGESYLFGIQVGEGQTLTATVTSVEDNAVFAILSPSGEALGDERTELVVPDTEKGRYEIVVGSVRGNTTFELSLDVR